MKPDKNDLNYIETDIFTLSIRGTKSIFYSNSFMSLISNQSMVKKENINPNKISSSYIITSEDNKIFHNARIESDILRYEEKELPKWTIINEFKIIDSLNCQKANTKYRGRDYVGWFTLDIPIADGPHKFKNLPGLILELNSTDGDYHFVLEGLQQSDEEISFPPAITAKSRNKYLKIAKQFAKNPSYISVQHDNKNSFKYKTFVNGKEVDNNEKYKLINKFVWEFMKTHNNPIEKDDLWIR